MIWPNLPSPSDQFLKTLSEIPAPAPVGRPSLAQLRGIRTKIDVFENKMAPAVRRGALSGTGIGANRKGAPSMPVLQEDLPAEQSASKATEMTPGAQRRQSLRAQARWGDGGILCFAVVEMPGGRGWRVCDTRIP